jgi:hypothetical protein
MTTRADVVLQCNDGGVAFADKKAIETIEQVFIDIRCKFAPLLFLLLEPAGKRF